MINIGTYYTRVSNRYFNQFHKLCFVFAISFVDLIMVVGTTKPFFSNYDRSSKVTCIGMLDGFLHINGLLYALKCDTPSPITKLYIMC